MPEAACILLSTSPDSYTPDLPSLAAPCTPSELPVAVSESPSGANQEAEDEGCSEHSEDAAGPSSPQPRCAPQGSSALPPRVSSASQPGHRVKGSFGLLEHAFAGLGLQGTRQSSSCVRCLGRVSQGQSQGSRDSGTAAAGGQESGTSIGSLHPTPATFRLTVSRPSSTFMPPLSEAQARDAQPLKEAAPGDRPSSSAAEAAAGPQHSAQPVRRSSRRATRAERQQGTEQDALSVPGAAAMGGALGCVQQPGDEAGRARGQAAAPADKRGAARKEEGRWSASAPTMCAGTPLSSQDTGWANRDQNCAGDSWPSKALPGAGRQAQGDRCSAAVGSMQTSSTTQGGVTDLHAPEADQDEADWQTAAAAAKQRALLPKLSDLQQLLQICGQSVSRSRSRELCAAFEL
jgi:hypothetical protein